MGEGRIRSPLSLPRKCAHLHPNWRCLCESHDRTTKVERRLEDPNTNEGGETISTQSKALQHVLGYHQVTKHSFQGHAAGPGYLDWDTQPDPFRRYQGARLLPLAKSPPTDQPLYDSAYAPSGIPPATIDHQSISQLLFDSLALSAWKVAGDSKWALRINPSSGNLHPTEGYLICGAVEGLSDQPMVCHYAPKEHALEVRAEFEESLWREVAAGLGKDTLLIALTSIHWREAWKYGQRAYRYCQHDVGHAIGAISIAAASLGWQARILESITTEDLSRLIGTSNQHKAEREEPDVLIAIGPGAGAGASNDLVFETIAKSFENLQWNGQPNHLSPSHIDWGMDQIARAALKDSGAHYTYPPRQPLCTDKTGPRPISLRQIIHQRRSAVSLDGKTSIPLDTFYGILKRTLLQPAGAPFDTLPWRPHLHLALFVHRVDNLTPGLYFLVRDGSQLTALQESLIESAIWKKPQGCPDDLPLYCLIEDDFQEVARQISCFQEIAGDGCFSLAMLAEFTEPLETHGPWFYPRLFWEAGLIGQVLYLEAEAAGIRATGIGCYFDDPMHSVLGLRDQKYQDPYHFTMGGPIEDTRLTTLPPYPSK